MRRPGLPDGACAVAPLRAIGAFQISGARTVDMIVTVVV